MAPTSLVSLRVWDGRREGLPSHTLTDTRRIFRQFHLLPLGIYFSLFCWFMNSTQLICCEVHTRRTCFLYLVSSINRRFFIWNGCTFLENQVLYLVFSKFRGTGKNITKSRPQNVQIRWLKVVKSSCWDTLSQSKSEKMSAKSIYRHKNSLSDTIYKLFSSFFNSKSISANILWFPDTFGTYFQMFICIKSIWRTNFMSPDTFVSFLQTYKSKKYLNNIFLCCRYYEQF